MERLRERSTGLPGPPPPLGEVQPDTPVREESPRDKKEKKKKKDKKDAKEDPSEKYTSTGDTRAELLKKTIKLSTQEQRWISEEG